MWNRRVVMVVAAALAWGCTSVTVRPVDRTTNLQHVCVQENPNVRVQGFLSVIRDGFQRHGISTEVFSGTPPSHCEFTLTYTALQSWDFVTYLSHAELRLEQQGREIASAEYHLKGKGGFSLMKYQGTRKKMDPVIDELLASS